LDKGVKIAKSKRGAKSAPINAMTENNTPTNETRPVEKMVTPDDIGKLLHLSGRAVCNHFHSKLLPGYRIGKSIRFRVSEVLEAIRKRSS
jgi:hypothetical protein